MKILEAKNKPLCYVKNFNVTCSNSGMLTQIVYAFYNRSDCSTLFCHRAFFDNVEADVLSMIRSPLSLLKGVIFCLNLDV